jgi:agmatinase
MNVPELNFNFGGLPDDYAAFETARILIWPVPFEATTTFMKGTALGPHAIIEASGHLELYDEELDAEIYRLGIHTLPPASVHAPLEVVIEQLYHEARRWLATGKFLCALGGEHSITSPIVRAVAELYPDLSVLQIDAHADLRPSYEGTPYSHASMAARLVEICPVVQVGVRALSLEEARARRQLPVTTFFAKDLRDPREWIPQVVEALSPHVYLTIDVDGLDPSLVPATGTPEPGGLSWSETLHLIRHTAERRTIVGMDVTELCPMPGHEASNFIVAKLVYKALGYIFHHELPRESL